jgi:uncharacterized RDD family membrane protein YckC
MNDSASPVHLGRRFSAGLIDFVTVPLLAVVLLLVTGAMEHAEDYAGNGPIIRPVLLGLSSYYLLNGWLLWSRGQSLGKAIVGIMIVRQGSTEKASAWNLLFIRMLFCHCWIRPLSSALGAGRYTTGSVRPKWCTASR